MGERGGGGAGIVAMAILSELNTSASKLTVIECVCDESRWLLKINIRVEPGHVHVCVGD